LCEFHQETNSFNPVTTTFEDFERSGVLEGKEMVRVRGSGPTAVAGMCQSIREAGALALPILSMSSQSGGRVEQAVLDTFLGKTLSVIRESMPVDGVFVSLHGATQTTEHDDACGMILRALREKVGEAAVIAASCDLHANVTSTMIKNADVICGYHTYPHVDFFETGYRAGKLGIDCLLRRQNLKMVCVRIPMIAPASGYTTLHGPFRELMAYGASLVKEEELVDFSIFQMQPWLDVEEGGSTVLAVAREYGAAERHAVDLAKRLLELRREFKPLLHEIDEVIDLAEANKSGKPVILVDSADSSNAGATGDSVAVVRRLLERESNLKTAFVLSDAPAAELAHSMGVGSKAVFSMGGAKDPSRSAPITVEAYVKSLHDGVFCQEGPAGRGLVRNIGRTAVLSGGNIDMVVCHSVVGNGDPQLYRAFGIEPTFYQLVVVKACTSYRAAYRELAATICDTNTPGAASVELLSLNFQKIPHSFYPFSDLDDYQISDIACARLWPEVTLS